ncbi:MAG TPA: allantoinase AllB [Terriglobia bacterium]|nr:allantoinase AllB [Terriglobia bacterium]
MTEVVVRGGTVVTPENVRQADVAIEDGFIRSVEPEIPGAREEIDARGLFVFPGLIDVHVHFNEPGHTEWEGAATGSRALAAGGGTLFFDMPLNSIPCTVNAREFDLKRSALEAAAVTDFALWGGLVPGNVQEMEALAQRGAVGFKAFLCHSGLDEFPRVDDLTLWEGLREAARLGLPVAVHAENHELIAALSRRMTEEGRQSIRDFLESRPVVAELEAIQRATLLAGEAGARLHIIHISSGRGVLLAAEARQRGVDVSIETCPHYLFLTDEDVERLGTVAKCAPPVRDRKEQDNLWTQLLGGNVDVVASDHSPSSPDRKAGAFWRAWGGIAGVQSTLAVLLDQGYHRRGLPLERIASLVAAEPARRFRIPDRGRIVVGASADLALVDLSATFTLKPEDLLQRHALSPYLGASFRGVVKRTIRRGETIFAEGKITAQGGGRLVRPVP